MAKRSRGSAGTKPVGSKKRKREPEINPEEEEILKKAQIYLLFEAERPMLWTVAGFARRRPRTARDGGSSPSTSATPPGFEGYLGDLLYDGTRFTELTDLELMQERGRQIAADPEGRRQWDEYTSCHHSTVRKSDNTCALACLRMILAAFGTDVEESTLEDQANIGSPGHRDRRTGALARRFGLDAHVREATVEQLRELLAEGKLAIAYIDRAVFDLTPRQRIEHRLRSARIHTVIPTHITAGAVRYHDPMPPARVRRSIGLFRSAYERLGSHCVVCSRPHVGYR